MIASLKNKKLLVLGGNPYADVIANFCAENEIVVYSMSNDRDAPIHEISTKKNYQSSSDKDLVLSYIEKEHIDGVFIGDNETVISSICKALCDSHIKCYCNEKQWFMFQNKGKFKEMCKRFGLPVLERYNYMPTHPCKVEFPVITKPADGCGSSGFSICNNYEELKQGFNIAKSCSNKGEVIVEKFVKNEGHVVFYNISAGNPSFCLLQDKYPFKYKRNGSFVAGVQVFPSTFTNEFISLFDEKLKKMFNSIGLKEGSLWIEVFHDGKNYYFNEAAYRYGGSITIFPVNFFTNINQVASNIYYALTGESKLYGFSTIIKSDAPRDKKYYCLYPVYLKPGKIGKINGFNELDSYNFIIKTIVKRKVGFIINDTGDFSQNFAYIHFVCNNKKEFNDIISLIQRTIEITDSFGNNMIISQSSDFFDSIRMD